MSKVTSFRLSDKQLEQLKELAAMTKADTLNAALGEIIDNYYRCTKASKVLVLMQEILQELEKIKKP